MRTKKVKTNTESHQSEILPSLNIDNTATAEITIKIESASVANAVNESHPEPLQPEPLESEPLESEPLESEPLESEPLESELKISISENIDNDENIVTNTVVVEKKKRGRKKLIKPDSINPHPLQSCDQVTNNNDCKNNDNNVDVSNTKDTNVNSDMVDKKEKKQRKVRISKKEKLQNANKNYDDVDNENDLQEASLIETNSSMTAPTSNVVYKKRGRKPRGGKIIHENQIQKNNSPEVPNIILHLKCVLSDLKKSNEISSHKLDNYCSEKKMEIMCYNDSDQTTSFSSELSTMSKYDNDCKNKIHYSKDIIKEQERKEDSLMSSNSSKQTYDPSTFSLKNIHPTPIPIITDSNPASNPVSFPFSDNDLSRSDCDCNLDCKSSTSKEIWKKISQLKLNFHKNDALGVQRSACFWDTCEFDTPPIYIPMSSTKGYGCFCHPECAVAFLMNEHIDTSIKFERYYLLNSIYGPIYNYNKSIKPAANPHYLLNKFYGNLTINEYRKLFQCEQVIYMVNKPLTNVLPELYEDNNDFFIGNKIIQNNTIEIKKKGTKSAKSSIINEVFGIR